MRGPAKERNTSLTFRRGSPDRVVKPSRDFWGSPPLVSKEAMYETAHGSAAAGGGDRPFRGRSECQRVRLRRDQLWLLPGALLRSTKLLPGLPDPDEDLLQARL